nr:PREDICTED: heat shock factor protein isoform X3 [Tribolium castaneum]|eukprot:XP_008199015.1 PREDICTED: heat shock factor protein isoform X3 [Tribolium castaneum]
MQPLGENAANTPAFLGKLWKMVNDPSTDHLICWSPSGTSFVIPNQAQFWYELLPLYYKHNNMSSFVRQLNMYGFHKMSTVENGTMDSDKDEIQFSHPYFLKDQPELLRNIKRKATTSKTSNENNNKHDELTKVLSDVKQLRGRQVSVDNQLNAMKQENALLWREVAILRQKHLKQQKIVNKLIQFLVTLVQPSRMTVGVKRGYQLMLHESPNKKSKLSNNGKSNINAEGPTIHELDSELDLTPNLYEEEVPVVEGSNIEIENDLCVSTPEELIIPDQDISEETLINSLKDEASPVGDVNVDNNGSFDNQKVFLNPSTQDTLLSNLIKNNTTKDGAKNGKPINAATSLSSAPVTSNNMAIATRDTNLCDVIKSMPGPSDTYTMDLNNHVEATQQELDQFKDILNGYNPFVDANALLGLFNGDSPVYDLNVNDDNKNENLIDPSDPLVSGSELTPYGGNFDFTELFDDTINEGNVQTTEATSSTVNTPQIIKEEPIFPAIQNKK